MDRLARLRKEFDTSPYAALMGMRLIELTPGYAKVEMCLSPDHSNWIGFVHGGVLMSLADHAFGCALNSLERTYVAVHVSSTFIAAPQAGARLVAEARVLNAGRRAGTVEIIVRSEDDASKDGKLVMEALGTSVVIEEGRFRVTAASDLGDGPQTQQ